MRICFLNVANYGSTGTIVRQLADMAIDKGHETLVIYPDSVMKKTVRRDDYIMEPHWYQYISGQLSSFSGFDCCFAFTATKKLLNRLDVFQPDVIHLHNIHGWYVNIPMLFRYIKKNRIKVVWTLHDCWAFTGHCPHFQENNCGKWKTGCYACEFHLRYPKSYLDNSKWMYRIKKACFTGVEDLTVVTPSHWLASMVKDSFLGGYPVRVIQNGINLSTFQPQSTDFCAKYHIDDKKIVLGVASQWNNKKGLDVFIDLAKNLPSSYQIVLVGTSDKIDAILPDNIISIHRTNNQKELAEIYSASDVFVNPTREDTFPTVNIESLACGTPVVTFDVGGSPEILDESCGIVVAKDDVEALKEAIIHICEDSVILVQSCVTRANSFCAGDKYEEYFSVYPLLI